MIALVPFLISILLMPLVAWAIYKSFDWLLNRHLRDDDDRESPSRES
jgi:hypothetical protein